MKIFFRILLIAVILIGIINGGWVLERYLTLNNAAREGARVAVVNEESPEAVREIKAVVKENAEGIIILDEDIEVDYAPVIGGQTTVTVSGYIMLPASMQPLPEYIRLRASAAMRQER